MLCAIMVDGIRRAIKDQLILAADLVGKQVRHAGLGPGGECRVTLNIDGAPPRRGIRDQQNLGACLGQGRWHPRVPNVLANRDPNLDAIHVDDFMITFTRIENALFIEHAIVWQFAFVVAQANTAICKQQSRVMKLSLRCPRRADKDGRTFLGTPGEVMNGGHGMLYGGRFEDQVLGRIAQDKQL